MSGIKKKYVCFNLAEKHNVSLTLFNGIPYFHIRNNITGKNVSLSLLDMKSLVDNYPAMKEKLKKMREEAEKEGGFEEDEEEAEMRALITKLPKKGGNKKKKRRHDFSDEEDEDDGAAATASSSVAAE